jgi:hypothetical protein
MRRAARRGGGLAFSFGRAFMGGSRLARVRGAMSCSRLGLSFGFALGFGRALVSCSRLARVRSAMSCRWLALGFGFAFGLGRVLMRRVRLARARSAMSRSLLSPLSEVAGLLVLWVALE